MRVRLMLIVGVLVAALAATADAQVRGRWYRAPYGYGARPFGYGAGYGYGSPYASNPIEGAQYGMAEMIRAKGEAYEATARGMNSYEEARSKYIDNKMKWTETYWERKRLGEAEIRKDYDEKRAARERYQANREPSQPRQLSPSELDPSTGKVYWPTALLSDDLENARRELEELFLLRAHAGGSERYALEIQQKTSEMKDALKEQIRDLPANDYIAARKFLDGLASEGQAPTG